MNAFPPARRLTARNVLAALGWWSLLIPVTALGLWLAAGFPASEPWGPDRAVLSWAAGQRTGLLDAASAAVTWAGSLYLLGPLAGLVLVSLLWRGRGCDGLLLALGLGGAALLSNFLKAFIDRDRPAIYEPLIALPADGAFPSGHAIQAAAFALALFLLARRRGWRRLPWLATALVVMVGAVGLSRIYLQVHYPTDVIAGLVLGVGWVLGLEQLAPGLGLGPAPEGQSREVTLTVRSGTGEG
jgi:undecaprenyl-diphosphatase